MTDDNTPYNLDFEKWAKRVNLSLDNNLLEYHSAMLSWQAAKELYEPKWLPIESAPKDGSHIIVCKIGLTHDTGGTEVGSAEWKKIIFETEPTIESIRWTSSARFEEGEWAWSMETLNDPTHWMPLPEQPQ